MRVDPTRVDVIELVRMDIVARKRLSPAWVCPLGVAGATAENSLP